ncbi:hypothetical protein D4R42_00685 [bacterium]|nr:MAG: hypothetical protein D4R42_00685 [bacterium]
MKNFTTLIKESFEIYKQKITPILLILLISGVVMTILGVSLGGSMMFSVLKLKDTAAIETVKALFSSPLVIGIFSVIVLWIIFIGLTFIILTVKPVGTKLKEIFQEAWKKFGQYLWLVILVSIFVTLSTLFFIIPGIIVGTYLTFYSYIFITEGKKGMEALKHSWKLVEGNWWKVFGRLFLLGIVFNIIYVLLSSVHDLLSSVFQLFYMPFIVIFSYLIYLELKKSKEIQIPTQTQPQA